MGIVGLYITWYATMNCNKTWNANSCGLTLYLVKAKKLKQKTEFSTLLLVYFT